MACNRCAGRRDVLKAGIGLGLQLGFSQLAPAQDNPAAIRPKEGDLLVKVDDSKATPLTPADIPLGNAATAAWPMDPSDKTIRSGTRFNQILLLRFDPAKLSDDTKPRAAEGVVAYTAICTHAGCEVNDWIREKQFLFCACHDSTFDPKDGARVVDGPAPRPLPALPLKVADGKLVVARPFTSRVGFEQQ